MAKIMEQPGGAGQGSRPLEIDPAIARHAPTVTAEAAAPHAAQEATASDSQSPAPKRRGLRPVLLAAVAVLGGIGYTGYNWWTTGRFIVSTDDAYVAADTATVTSKIAGYVKSVPAPDNTHVKAGDPLVILDDADARIALAQAEAQIATGQAAVERIGQQIVAGNAAVASAKAQLASATAAAGNADAQFGRVDALGAKQFATTAAVDAARTVREQARQAVVAATAAVAAAEANVGVVTAQKTEAERALDQYRLARDQAQLNLDHTVIRAPFDGVVGNGAAEPGEFVQPGQRLVALVPLDAVYIDANFKETQLADLKPGQTVAVTVDAYPDLAVTGTVVSVAPASGSVFSLLPPDNATGNFTKIVQRIPVRIRLPADVTVDGLIRPGMSVVAAVDTRSGGPQVAAR
jgi:membrane fusion protein, multidrug efflux system